ncbi:MAG: Smr/MutS family protein [Proteobacteria bacterium]|nr:Smr/MutS family protein [Pseudomonadota bacterium]MBU1640950.1 Smr/MutS family protein [Pseudomonadota bacterium]
MAGTGIHRIRGEEYPFGEMGHKSATFSELFDDASVDEAAVQRELAREGVAMEKLREAGTQSYPPPQDTLDLHGCTAQEAEVKALRFVEGARRRGILTVRIITGKGLHSPGGKAVLPDTIEQVLGLLKKEGGITSFQWDKKVKSKSGSLLVYL